MGEDGRLGVVEDQVGRHALQQQVDELLGRVLLDDVEEQCRVFDQRSRHVDGGAHLRAEILQRQPLLPTKIKGNTPKISNNIQTKE